MRKNQNHITKQYQFQDQYQQRKRNSNQQRHLKQNFNIIDSYGSASLGNFRNYSNQNLNRNINTNNSYLNTNIMDSNLIYNDGEQSQINQINNMSNMSHMNQNKKRLSKNSNGNNSQSKLYLNSNPASNILNIQKQKQRGRIPSDYSSIINNNNNNNNGNSINLKINSNQKKKRSLYQPSATYNEDKINQIYEQDHNKTSKFYPVGNYQNFHHSAGFQMPPKSPSKKINFQISEQQRNLQQQLNKELKEAKADIWRFNNYLKNIKIQEIRYNDENNNQIATNNQLQQFLELQKLVRAKDFQIKQLSQEIKSIKDKANKKKNYQYYRKDENLNQNNDKSDLIITNITHPLILLTQEIRSLRQQLKKIQKEHAQKTYDYQMKKQNIFKVQNDYIRLCQRNDEKPLTFQEFKEKRRQKMLRQQASKIVNEKSSKNLGNKNFQSLKTKIANLVSGNSIANPPTFQNIQQSNNNQSPPIVNNLKKKNPIDLQKYTIQLNAKKHVAQNALKNAKKKHQNQIQQLLQKIEFLKEEEQNLDNKIQQKQKEMESAEIRFNQAKKRDRSNRSNDSKFDSASGGGTKTPKSTRNAYSSRKPF